jgi:hypothetical protein
LVIWYIFPRFGTLLHKKSGNLVFWDLTPFMTFVAKATFSEQTAKTRIRNVQRNKKSKICFGRLLGTRLGEFLPFGRIKTKTLIVKIFELLFRKKMLCIQFDKIHIGWATFCAKF